MISTDPIPIEEIRAAEARIRDSVVSLPLIPLNLENKSANIFLKLENLQPIGSFKLRGAGNAIQRINKNELSNGEVTASTGNMAQGVAWYARKMGIPCTVVVPDTAPKNKLDAVKRLDGKIVTVTFNEWWRILSRQSNYKSQKHFIHPVSDRDVIAGHGTIGLEIINDLPEVDTIVIPYGGGGLSSGIASAVRQLKPDTRIYACEVETAAPLYHSLQAGKPCEVDHKPTFIEGIGGKSVLAEMWPLVSSLLDGSLVVSLAEIVDSIRLLIMHNNVVAEGAGAAPVAAALSGKAGTGNIVCVVSGGNIDTEKLIKIIHGEIP